MNTAWKCLSVREFVDRCNWENISRPTTAKAISQQRSLADWQCMTAQEFFVLQNWSGQRVVADAWTASAAEVEAVFNMTLRSEQFWQCFNWNGERETPAPQKVELILEDTQTAISEVEEFTLNDLSQLF